MRGREEGWGWYVKKERGWPGDGPRSGGWMVGGRNFEGATTLK